MLRGSVSKSPPTQLPGASLFSPTAGPSSFTKPNIVDRPGAFETDLSGRLPKTLGFLSVSPSEEISIFNGGCPHPYFIPQRRDPSVEDMYRFAAFAPRRAKSGQLWMLDNDARIISWVDLNN